VLFKRFFSALFFSPDEFSLETFRKVFDVYGIDLNPVGSVAEMDRLIPGRRFDLAVCDFDVPGISQLAFLQPSAKWGGVVMGLGHAAQARNLAAKRVHVILHRPLHSGLVARSLRAVYSTMARHRLINYRHKVELNLLAGTVIHHGMRQALKNATVCDLSQTGLCLRVPEPLPLGAHLSARLPLPGSEEVVAFNGKIVWSNGAGRTGIQFQGLSPLERAKLQQGLDAKLGDVFGPSWSGMKTPSEAA